MRVGNHEVYAIECTNDEDLWNAFNAVTQSGDFVGVAVLNHKLKLVGNHVPRLCDLICDFSPKCTLVINEQEYDSDTFTRDAPLNMLSDSVIFGKGVQILQTQTPEIEYTVTVVYLMEQLRRAYSSEFK